jgi:UDP-glucose 4-epimerase
VRVLDDLSTGSRANLDDLPVELVIADLAEADAVRAAARGVDTIFHLAAMISVPASLENPSACYATNVLGSVNVLEAARREKVRRVVLASSCAVYGEREGRVGEDEPPRPLSPYAASKLAMEEAASLYHTAFGLVSFGLRLFNVYGPRQDARSPYAAVIPLFIQAMLDGQAPTIHGDGRQSRDFVYVEDVARAALLAADAAPESGGTFNVGSGKSTMLLDLLHELRRLIPGGPDPAFGPPRPGDIRSSGADIGRAAKSLGYRPAWDLHTGLGATIEWLRAAAGPAAAK